MEWILIITMNIKDQPLQVRDIAPTIVSGFHTKAACDSAGQDIAAELIGMAGSHRREAGIPGNRSIQSPSIWTRCLQVKKG